MDIWRQQKRMGFVLGLSLWYTHGHLTENNVVVDNKWGNEAELNSVLEIECKTPVVWDYACLHCVGSFVSREDETSGEIVGTY